MTLDDPSRGRRWLGSTRLICRPKLCLRNRASARSAVRSSAVRTEHLPECMPSEAAVDATRLHAANGHPSSTDHVTAQPVQTLAAGRDAARRCRAWSAGGNEVDHGHAVSGSTQGHGCHVCEATGWRLNSLSWTTAQGRSRRSRPMAVVQATVARSDALPAPSSHRTIRSPCRPVQMCTVRVPQPSMALEDLRNRASPARRRPAGPGARDRQEKPDRPAQAGRRHRRSGGSSHGLTTCPVNGRDWCRRRRSEIGRLSIVCRSSRVNHLPSGSWRRPRPLSAGGVAPCNPPCRMTTQPFESASGTTFGTSLTALESRRSGMPASQSHRT